MYVKFKNTYNFEGTDYEGIDLDFESLTGNDIEKAVDALTLTGRSLGNGMPEFSKAFCAQISAIASKKPGEFIRGLPVREYTKVTVAAQNFLLDGVSELASMLSAQ